LLRHTTGVIQDNIKSQFCFVDIKATPDTKARIIGTGEFQLSKSDSDVLSKELIKTGRRTVITDELESEFDVLKDVLSKNKIGLLIRLIPGNDMSKSSMYYLVLGYKKSGNVYSVQDKRI